MDKKVGHYAFIGSMLLALVVGILNPIGILNPENSSWLVSLMVLGGIITGWMNIDKKQKKDFMIVGTVFIIAAIGGAPEVLGGVFAVLAQGNASALALGQYLVGIFQGILTIVIPAVVVVSLREIWEMAQNK